MALSEREQRLLEEMERHLYQSEADVLDTRKPVSGKPNYRAIIIGVVVLAVGVGALLTGVMIQQPIVGLIGFVAMLAGVLYVFSPARSDRQSSGGAGRNSEQSSGRKSSSQSFATRMEQRWQERGDGRR